MITYEKIFFNETLGYLSEDSISKMNMLINDLISLEETNYHTEDILTFSELRSDPGRIGLDSILKEIEKLKIIQQLELPETLFNNIPNKVLKKYKQRAVSEDIKELRRHPESVRYTLLSAFFWFRQREIIDNLIELLIQIIHKISVRAERKIEKEFINDFRRVNGKTNILFKIADAALNNPDGIIKNVKEIGDIVSTGEVIARISDREVHATIDGVLRGIIRDGFKVTENFKIADIDPRINEQKNCFTISDKARSIGGGVLESVFLLMRKKEIEFYLGK